MISSRRRVAPRQRMHLIATSFLIACAMLNVACLIEPIEETATLHVAIETPGDATGAVDAQAWDEQGRQHLDRFGKFVRLALQRPFALHEQVSVAWPAMGRAEDPNGIVALNLAVEPGAYRAELLGYVVEKGRVFAYRESEAPLLRLLAGKTTETEIVTRLHPCGALAIQIVCRTSDLFPFIKAQISLVDARARVVFPPVTVEGSPPFFVPANFDGVPVGRPFQVRVILTNEIDESVRVLEIIQPLLTVSSVGNRQVAVLKIPCI